MPRSRATQPASVKTAQATQEQGANRAVRLPLGPPLSASGGFQPLADGRGSDTQEIAESSANKCASRSLIAQHSRIGAGAMAAQREAGKRTWEIV